MYAKTKLKPPRLCACTDSILLRHQAAANMRLATHEAETRYLVLAAAGAGHVESLLLLVLADLSVLGSDLRLCLLDRLPRFSQAVL